MVPVSLSRKLDTRLGGTDVSCEIDRAELRSPGFKAAYAVGDGMYDVYRAFTQRAHTQA